MKFTNLLFHFLFLFCFGDCVVVWCMCVCSSALDISWDKQDFFSTRQKLKNKFISKYKVCVEGSVVVKRSRASSLELRHGEVRGSNPTLGISFSTFHENINLNRELLRLHREPRKIINYQTRAQNKEYARECRFSTDVYGNGTIHRYLQLAAQSQRDGLSTLLVGVSLAWVDFKGIEAICVEVLFCYKK